MVSQIGRQLFTCKIWVLAFNSKQSLVQLLILIHWKCLSNTWNGLALQIFSQAKRWVVVQAKLGTRGFCFGQHSKEKEAKRKIALLHFVQSLGVSLRNKFLRSVFARPKGLAWFYYSFASLSHKGYFILHSLFVRSVLLALDLKVSLIVFYIRTINEL